MTTNPVTAVRAVDGAVASPAVRRDPATHAEPSLTINVELLGWLAVLVVAGLFRLLDLSAIPLRPDESLRAWSAFEFSRGTVTPEWGGDLGSALAALIFRLAGDSETTARLVPAIAGVLAVGCLAFYRPLVGRGAALIAALVVAVSPVAIAGARTLGPEAVALPLALLLPPLTASVWLDGHRSRLPLLALVFGLGLGTGALVPAVAIVLLAWLAVERGWLHQPEGSDAATDRPWDRTLLAISVFALLPGLLLAVARYGAGLDRLTLAAVRAWNGPPALATPPQSWHWVPDALVTYEPLALALG
ncbi:MAG: glycosyltransferase family 39 protein, partial [Dehalococcoidia bacterium]